MQHSKAITAQLAQKVIETKGSSALHK